MTSSRRAATRLRRRTARVLLVVPVLVVLGIDLFERHADYAAMLHTDGAALGVTWSISALLWTCAVVVAARRRSAMAWFARFVLVLLGALVALQAAANEYFGATIDYQLLTSAWRLEGMSTLARPFIGIIARWMATGAVAAVGFSLVVRWLARARRKAARRAFAALVALLVVATVGSSYLPHFSTDAAADVLALGSSGRFAIERPRRTPAPRFAPIPEVDFPRTVPPVPPAQPRAKRNVLFILTESVRASSYCSAPTPECATNPFSNALLPDRLPLERMRSVGTFTLLSFGVLFTGIPIDAPTNDWLTAPLLFDYAHAGGVATAYWSAQHATFAKSYNWTNGEPIDKLAWARDLDPDADGMTGADDALVIDRAMTELPQLHEPFFAVVHFSGTHFPYRVDTDGPFQPTGTNLDRRAPEPLRNRYLDSIHRQDKYTGRLVSWLRKSSFGPHTVIVFLSDHGESFYEHESVLHGSSLWDTELHVPAWIDAPAGVLSSDEIASLRAMRDVSVTHEDVAPTILDLLGLWRVDAWKDFTAKMRGDSLLRSPAHDRTTTIATCNKLWACFVPATGKLVGDRKSIVRPPQPVRCFDTRADPLELHDLGASACGQ